VKFPGIVQRHRAVRWLAPVGVICLAALAATGMFKTRPASEPLPGTTPAGLVAAVRTSDVEGFSGTVVSQLSLGLPELPAIGNAGDGTSLTSLLSGSHTLQVWYGGAEKQRIALLGPTDETDVFRNGRDMWQWSSADQVALHTLLPAGAGPGGAAPLPSAVASMTPVELARKALGDLDPTTRVTVEDDRTVADRSVYELLLMPRTSTTKIGSVHIAVDGRTKIPLGVQVYARGVAAPALDVAFTSIRFARQSNRNFVFSPPPSATVRQLGPAARSSGPAGAKSAAADLRAPTMTGAGWTTVFGMRPGKAAITKLGQGALLKALKPVSGSWGTGRLLDSALLSVLVTNDGRVFAGAVAPSKLYTAAGSK
jgi:outer membrane lipoprotein-sorting protein